MIKIYTCTDFTGFNPVGSAAVVRATSASTAAMKLNVELKKLGLPGDAEPSSMLLLVSDVVILNDGNY